MLLQVFIVSSKKIQERNYETLFRWLTQSNKINIIGRVVLSVPPMWQVCKLPLPPSGLMLCHFAGVFQIKSTTAKRLRPRMCMCVIG